MSQDLFDSFNAVLSTARDDLKKSFEHKSGRHPASEGPGLKQQVSFVRVVLLGDLHSIYITFLATTHMAFPKQCREMYSDS